MSGEPARLEAALAWDLRGAWAGGWPVACTTRDGARLLGRVEHVAATCAFALLWDGREQVHVPVALLRSVRRPHFHEDGPAPAPRARAPRLELPHPGQLAIPVCDGRPQGWEDPRAALAERRAAGRRRAVREGRAG